MSSMDNWAHEAMGKMQEALRFLKRNNINFDEIRKTHQTLLQQQKTRLEYEENRRIFEDSLRKIKEEKLILEEFEKARKVFRENQQGKRVSEEISRALDVLKGQQRAHFSRFNNEPNIKFTNYSTTTIEEINFPIQLEVGWQVSNSKDSPNEKSRIVAKSKPNGKLDVREIEENEEVKKPAVLFFEMIGFLLYLLPPAKQEELKAYLYDYINQMREKGYPEYRIIGVTAMNVGGIIWSFFFQKVWDWLKLIVYFNTE